MSDVAIKVEGLGKKYLLRHQAGGRPRYVALRDVLAGKFKGMFNRKSKIENRKSVEEFWALRDVSFEVRQGEAVGIIGRNGAGKSTLLKLLSRITEPTKGRIELEGRVASLLEVGTGFHPELTGRENIFLNGAILGMRRAEIRKKFDEIVAFAEVEKFLDTPVKHYSSGMYMRLAFAVAAHLEPEILIVDEVLAVGDAAFQKKCLGKMQDVSTKEGRTVLFVSHNMAAVRSLCSRSILLDGGKIAMAGQVEECISRYLLSAQDMPAKIHTANLRRREDHDAKALRITSVTLGEENTRAICFSGQPLVIRMEFEVTVALESVIFGVGAYSSDGVRIFECRSVDSFRPIENLSPGKYSLRCTLLNNPLNVGLYSLHVGSRCASKGLDYLPDVMSFRVETTKQHESLWFEQCTGLVILKSEWCIPERQSSSDSLTAEF